MGIDWTPARLSDNADLAELPGLVALQAGLCREVISAVGQEARTALDQVSSRLLGALAIGARRDGGWPSFRVSVITMNPLFPPEWRAAACATFLPEDAAAAVARWRWWHDQVTSGGMSHYLARLAAWDASQDLTETQDAAISHARLASTQPEAWAQKDQFSRAMDQILALPPVPRVEPPGPPPGTARDDQPIPGQEDQATALAIHHAAVTSAARAFNRTVPRSRRLRLPDPQLGGTGLPAGTWFTQFADWVAPYLASGHGLFLWC